MPELETIASYWDLPLAELAKAKLESEGIYCFLLNKHHVGVNWLYSQAVGGVQVQVQAKDAEAAKKILEADESALLAEMEEEFPEAEQEDSCTRCGSTNLSYINLSRRAGALTILLQIPLILFGIRSKCRNCGHKMKQ
ncbi:MAG: DUF2007 domain-containing protein [Candidatus Electrothrix sp. AR3]|nr:DUF2007 domain-containing protein [Candidatus Electrothrix sp. AR3]